MTFWSKVSGSAVCQKLWGERFHQFGNIHWDLSRANAHTETIYDTTNDQHSDILRGTDDDRADAPIGKNKKAPISLPILKNIFAFTTDCKEAYQMIEPTMIDFFRPRISERNPETRAPSQEPPAIEAVMPPWTSALGPGHFFTPST